MCSSGSGRDEQHTRPAGLLEARDILIRRGGFPVIDIPELAVERGKVVSLIGPNGSGKSTLMLALASLLKPYQGTIFFQGQPIDSRTSGPRTAENLPWCSRSRSCLTQRFLKMWLRA